MAPPSENQPQDASAGPSSSASEQHVPRIEREALNSVVRRATRDEAVEVADWTCEQLAYTELNPVSGGVWIVRGTAGGGADDWSVVLKILRLPRGGTLPTGRPVPAGWGEEPSHHNYWRREALALASGALEDLHGVGAPRYLGTEEPSAEEVWLWMEHVKGAEETEWSTDDYAFVAHRLGRLNGSYVAGRPLPSGAWVSRNLLLGWTDDFGPAIEDLAALGPSDPALGALGSPDIRRRVLDLWEQRELLCRELERLPQTFCHLDAFPSNLLICPQDERRVIAVDWAFPGMAAVGEELVQLVVPSMILLGMDVDEGRRIQDVALDGYLHGLREAGAVVDPSDVRAAYALAAALRWVFPSVDVFGRAAEDESVRALMEQVSRRPFEQAVEHGSEVLSLLLDLADEGRAVLR